MLTQLQDNKVKYILYEIVTATQYEDIILKRESDIPTIYRLDVALPTLVEHHLTHKEYVEFFIAHSKTFIDEYVFDDRNEARIAWLEAVNKKSAQALLELK